MSCHHESQNGRRSAEELRDGGVPGWRSLTIGDLGEIYSGTTPSRANPSYWGGEIPWVTPSDVTALSGKMLKSTADCVTQAGLVAGSLKLLPPGSLLTTTRATIGEVAIAACPVTTNQGFKSLVVGDSADPLFVYYLLRTKVAEMYRLSSGSTFPEISTRDFASIHIDLPPLPEQHRIAEILGTVDEAIQQTEALIAKLKEMRQGLLHDLLTRGLDENGELRDPVAHPEQFEDSPLRRIPKEWEVGSFGDSLLGIDAGVSPDCPDIPAAAGQWGVLKVSAVRPGGFQPSENKVVLDRRFHSASLEVQTGDLLISRANTYELVGLVCLVDATPPNLILSDKTLRLRTDPAYLLTEFAYLILLSSATRSQIENNATGSSGSMKNISQATIRALQIPLPSVEEQGRICTTVQQMVDRVRKEQGVRAKLQLLKNALMQDLLTGRVRVPALATEPELIEAG